MAQKIGRVSLIALFFCIQLFPVIHAYADQWVGPTEKSYSSPDGRWKLTTVPGNSWGDLVGFKGSAKGEYAKARLKGPRGEKSFTLLNPVAPVDALVLNSGISLVFDNWHNMGYGKVAAAYSPEGEVLWAKELEELLDKDLMSIVSTSVSSRWWRKSLLEANVEPLGNKNEGAIVITLRNEDKLKLDIATGDASHLIVRNLQDDPKRMLQRAYTMDKEPQEAIALLRKVVSLEPKNIPAWRLLGEDLTRTREYQDVIDAMKTAIDTVPQPGKNDNDWTTYLYLFIIRSKAEKELKYPAAAEATLLKCISIDPTFEDSVFTLGNFLYDQKRGDDADRFLRQSYEVKVEHNKLFSYMNAKRFGDFYHSRRLHEKAITYYLKGYSSDKITDQWLYQYLAESYEALEEYDDAIRVLNQLMEWWKTQSNPSIWQRDIDRTEANLKRLREKSAAKIKVTSGTPIVDSLYT